MVGTHADFYLGRDSTAQWLGSIAYDGYPDGLPEDVVKATSLEEFKSAVEALMSESHATRPERGWPWPWETSHTTDYAYAWDNGVWVSCFGYPWLTMAQREHGADECAKQRMPPDAFPNMHELQNVALDDRSGIMLIG